MSKEIKNSRDYRLLKFLISQNNLELFNKNPLVVAAKNNDIELLKYLIDNNIERNYDYIDDEETEKTYKYRDDNGAGFQAIYEQNLEIYLFLCKDAKRFGCSNTNCGKLIIDGSLTKFCNLYLSGLKDHDYKTFYLDCVRERKYELLNSIEFRNDIEAYYGFENLDLNYPDIIEILLNKITNNRIREDILTNVFNSGSEDFICKIIREQDIYSSKCVKICINRDYKNAVKEFILFGKYFEYIDFKDSFLAYSYDKASWEIFDIFLDLWNYSLEFEEWFIEKIFNIKEQIFEKIFIKFKNNFIYLEKILQKFNGKFSISDKFFTHLKDLEDNEGNNFFMIYVKNYRTNNFESINYFLDEMILYYPIHYKNNKGENIFDIIANHIFAKELIKKMIEKGFHDEIFNHPVVRKNIYFYLR